MMILGRGTDPSYAGISGRMRLRPANHKLLFLFSSATNEKRAFDLDDDVYAEYVEQLLTELHKNPDDDLQKFLDDAEDRKLEMDVNEYYEW